MNPSGCRLNEVIKEFHLMNAGAFPTIAGSLSFTHVHGSSYAHGDIISMSASYSNCVTRYVVKPTLV